MQTQDPVNQPGLEVSRRIGETRLGLLKNWEWHDDPRRLLFSMARYKFVAKMFAGRERVLELGCGDAFCAPIVKQTVKHLTVTDFDPVYIEDARSRMREPWVFDARVVDIRTEPLPGRFDGIYSLDVFEHIPESEEDAAMVGSSTRSNHTAPSSSACPRSSRRPMPRRPARPGTSIATPSRSCGTLWRAISTTCSCLG